LTIHPRRIQQAVSYFHNSRIIFPMTQTRLWRACNFVKTCPETLLFCLSMSLMNTDHLFHCASLILESNTTVARYSKVHGMFFRDCTNAIASKIQTDWFGSTPLCSEPFSIMLLKAALFVFTKQPSVMAIDQGIEPSSCRRISLIFTCLDWAITNNLANKCLPAFKMVFLSVLETGFNREYLQSSFRNMITKRDIACQWPFRNKFSLKKLTSQNAIKLT